MNMTHGLLRHGTKDRAGRRFHVHACSRDFLRTFIVLIDHGMQE
jgi:hypothetical protein